MKRGILKRVLNVCLTCCFLLVSTTLMSNACFCDMGPDMGTCAWYNAPGYPKIEKEEQPDGSFKCTRVECTVYAFQCGTGGGDYGVCGNIVGCFTQTPIECPEE